MTTIMSAARLNWTLEGWRQWDWAIARTTESTLLRAPDIGPVPARFPGSVRGALLDAGLVDDPLFGTQSRASEFIENRHWIYRAFLPFDFDDGVIHFEADCVDGRAEFRIDDRVVGTVGNAHRQVRVPLGEARTIGGHELSISFLTQPDELGQMGRTSEMRALKPRFNYGWDWVPRIVQLGVAGRSDLVVSKGGRIRRTVVVPHSRRTEPASIDVDVAVDGAAGCRIEIVVTGHNEAEVVRTEVRPRDGENAKANLVIPDALRWVPAGDGYITGNEPNLYGISIRLLDAAGADVDVVTLHTGFRSIEWSRAPHAPAGSLPWNLRVDGSPRFVQGVNWVPIRPDFADVDVSEYRVRLETYARLGVNLVRVWGGATIERDVFYDICDELGLMVWQDLPLSSSGLDNKPPDDDEFVQSLSAIATEWAERLAHHPCVVVWSGGNELAEGHPMPGVPLTFNHPALASIRDGILSTSESAHVLPTTPSGPRYLANEAEYGLGIHHDVHGPWGHSGNREEWLRYWREDDALFRSEVGIAGASSVDVLARYGLDDASAGLAELWRHSSAWWVADNDVPSLENLVGWVDASQARQADLLAIAAATSKLRFPECGGFVIWMGHDSFPCAVSLSLLNVDGTAKPAAAAVGKVFRSGSRSDLEHVIRTEAGAL